MKKLPRSADNYGITENNLTIVRNGWGYTNLQIECEGEFVFTEKETLQTMISGKPLPPAGLHRQQPVQIWQKFR